MRLFTIVLPAACVLCGPGATQTIRVKLGAAENGSGLLLANDATEPGAHILAQATGSSLKLANKDGRERVITP